MPVDVNNICYSKCKAYMPVDVNNICYKKCKAYMPVDVNNICYSKFKKYMPVDINNMCYKSIWFCLFVLQLMVGKTSSIFFSLKTDVLETSRND